MKNLEELSPDILSTISGGDIDFLEVLIGSFGYTFCKSFSNENVTFKKSLQNAAIGCTLCSVVYLALTGIAGCLQSVFAKDNKKDKIKNT